MIHLPVPVPQHNLAILAATIRTAHAGVTLAATNLIEHALKAGDALIAAKAAVGHGRWLPWLKEECDLSEDRAERYMRIARGRATLEADSARVRNLSLTGALKLLPSPRRKGGASRRKTTQGVASFDALGWWSAATLEARRKFIDGVGSRPLAAAIPAAWNMTLVPAGASDEIGRLHQHIAELKAQVQQRDLEIAKLQPGLPDAPVKSKRDRRAPSRDELEARILEIQRSSVTRHLSVKEWKALDRMKARAKELQRAENA